MLHPTSGRNDFYPVPAASAICTHAGGTIKPEKHVQLLIYLPSGATFALRCPWNTPHSKILRAVRLRAWMMPAVLLRMMRLPVM